MLWRNTITHWLSGKQITQDGNLATLEIIKLLIDENTIPPVLVNNSTLHSIVLTQIVLEMLTGITVPRVFQEGDTNYRMDARETMMLNLTRTNEKQVLTLERETGVNLDHYYKLNINNN